jgi:uncharacterized LabA/DUF88 family protein
MKKILLIVDLSNIFYCVRKKFNNKVNYTKLKNTIPREGEVIHRAIAYGAQMDNGASEFISFMTSIGFETKYKEPKILSRYVDARTNQEREIRRADWDVGMAMDVVKILDQVDVVVFCTADSDMAPCIEYVQFRGKEARVLACAISFELWKCCPNCREIHPDILQDESPEATNEVELHNSVSGDAAPAPTQE